VVIVEFLTLTQRPHHSRAAAPRFQSGPVATCQGQLRSLSQELGAAPACESHPLSAGAHLYDITECGYGNALKRWGSIGHGGLGV